MRINYKYLFWLGIAILITTNLYWIYSTIDNAVGHTYYRESCEGYYQDMINFKQIVELNKNKKDVIEFLEQNNVKYDSFTKGSDYIIKFNSFDLIFNEKGNLIQE